MRDGIRLFPSPQYSSETWIAHKDLILCHTLFCELLQLTQAGNCATNLPFFGGTATQGSEKAVGQKSGPVNLSLRKDPSRAGRVNRWYTTRHLKLAERSTNKFAALFPPFCLSGSPKYNEQGAFQFLKSTLPHQWLLSLGSPSGGFGQGGWKFTF